MQKLFCKIGSRSKKYIFEKLNRQIVTFMINKLTGGSKDIA